MRVVPAFHGGGPEIDPSIVSKPAPGDCRFDLERGCRRDGVHLDEQRFARGACRGVSDGLRHGGRGLGRNDREDDVGLAD